MRARRGTNAFGTEQILDGERQSLERTALPSRQPLIRPARHDAGALGRFHDKSIQRSRLPNGSKMSFGQFCRGKLFFAQRLARLRQRERSEIGHPVFGSSQKNGFFSVAESIVEEARSSLTLASGRIGSGCTGNPANNASTAAGSSGCSRR